MSHNPTIEELISKYNLKEHPEGGYYCETYRSSEVLDKKTLPSRFNGARTFSTAILFLLPEGEKSKLHRIKSDEIWYFHGGGELTITQISPEGDLEEISLGPLSDLRSKIQHVVPTGYIFGAKPKNGSKYSFVSCSVSPGFDFKDFELFTREYLIEQYPNLKAQIEKLT